MLPMSNERIEQNADFSLKLRSVALKDLGPYSCQVRTRKEDIWMADYDLRY